jgi:tRNA 5-methylaminomethyl-2-thiouridine biosynthesis bifunctional protein
MNNKEPNIEKTKVMVIGAGVAGSSIAGELSRLGYEVHLYDKNKGPALETSAHETALAHPHVGKKKSKLQRFTQLANRLANQKWSDAQLGHSAFEPCRELSLAQWSDLSDLFNEVGLQKEVQILTKDEAYFQTNIPATGLWYPTAAIYSLPKICKKEISSIDKNHIYWNCQILKIQKEKNNWQVFNHAGEVIGSAPVLILAGGVEVQNLLKTIDIDLPIRPVRGQLTTFHIKKESLLVQYLPKKVIRGDGYCLPAKLLKSQDWHWEIGSSYDEDQTDTLPWGKSDQDNAIKALNLIGCEHLHLKDMLAVNAFVGIRSASKDRLPLLGPIPNQPGLLVACAYGSRGVLWSALGASVITAYVDAFFAGADRLRAGFLTGASASLFAEVVSSVNPGRFLRGALATRASNSKPIFPVS